MDIFQTMDRVHIYIRPRPLADLLLSGSSPPPQYQDDEADYVFEGIDYARVCIEYPSGDVDTLTVVIKRGSVRSVLDYAMAQLRESLSDLAEWKAQQFRRELFSPKSRGSLCGCLTQRGGGAPCKNRVTTPGKINKKTGVPFVGSGCVHHDVSVAGGISTVAKYKDTYLAALVEVARIGMVEHIWRADGAEMKQMSKRWTLNNAREED
jgi:hypothetical protein